MQNLNLGRIVAQYEEPKDWPRVARILSKFHMKIEGQDDPSIASIIEQNLDAMIASSGEKPNRQISNFALKVGEIVDNYDYNLNDPHYVPRHDPDIYHTYDHFREAVINTIFISMIYNKAGDNNGLIVDDRISADEILTLATAMACHDFARGLGPSEANYGMEIRACEFFVEMAKGYNLQPEATLTGAVAILATSPFVAINPDQTWFIGGQKIGSFQMLAQQVDQNETLSKVSGLSDALREIKQNSRLLFLAQIAGNADILTSWGHELTERASRKVMIEDARAKGLPDPQFDEAGLILAKAGNRFLSYVGELPGWFNKMTNYAGFKLLSEFRGTIQKLESQTSKAAL